MKFEELNKVLDYISGRYFHHDLTEVRISFVNTSSGVFIHCFDPRDKSTYRFHYEENLREIEEMDKDEYERKKTKEVLELEKKLREAHINFYEPEDCEIVTYLIIRACELGDNFYDYGEERRPVTYSSDRCWLSEYVDNGTIYVEECNCCCGCGGG